MKASDLALPKGMKVYLDMDGVLADFFSEYAKLAGVTSYREIPPAKADPTLNKMIGTDFFNTLPKFPSADKLVDIAVEAAGSYGIISSPLRGDFENSALNKKKWVKRELTPQPTEVYITPNKAKYAIGPDGMPNVLIDDRGTNITAWEAAGGIGIKYQADENSLKVVLDGLKRARRVGSGAEKLEPQNLVSKDRGGSTAIATDDEDTKESIYQLKDNFADSRIKIEYIDVDSIHADALKEHLLTNPALYEDTEDYKNLRKFLDVYKTDTPKVEDEYVYTSVQSIPVSKFVNIAHFKKPHKLIRLEKGYALFQIDNEIKRVPETGMLSGDALTEIYFFKSINLLEKFVMFFDLKFSDYKKSKRIIDENFADGKVKGKSRPGRVKKAGASCKGSVTSLRAKAKKYGGEKGKMYHWCANMKGGKK